MRMEKTGNAILREIANKMSPATLQVAASYFWHLLENNKQLVDSWEAATKVTEDDRKDSRNLIIRLAKHVCDTQVRDMGSVVYTHVPNTSGEDVMGLVVEFHLDTPEEGHELKHMLLKKITLNNLQMVLTIGGKLRDADAPTAVIADMLRSIGLIEFNETAAMLRGQVDLLKQAAAQKGAAITTEPPPLDAWLPPKGAPGH